MAEKLEVTISEHATCWINKYGCKHFDFENLSKASNIPHEAITHEFVTIDSLISYMLCKIEGMSSQIIADTIGGLCEEHEQDKKKKATESFYNAMHHFFNEFPFGQVYIHLLMNFANEQKFKKDFYLIEKTWVEAIRKADLLLNKEDPAMIFFRDTIKAAEEKI